jgi:AraC-like DNA-binding protein
MHGDELNRNGIAPTAPAASAVAAFFVDEIDRDSHRVAVPCPEIQIVVRFGPSARNGLDVHAFGMQQTVRRKLIRRGQRAVTARLHLGASKKVLGVPASAVAGFVLPLEELWGGAAVQRLLDRLSGVNDAIGAIAIMEGAITERLGMATRASRSPAAKGRPTQEARDAEIPLALRAAERLVSANVSAVAVDLGVSERHLRRVFRESIGMSPKEFARLARFRRAIRAAREDSRPNWATIAAETGYYDQSHLIEEFRSIAGVAPRAFLSELATASHSAERPAPMPHRVSGIPTS